MSETPEFIHLLRKMGHDMRVPLNTLISTSDMLVTGAYDPLTAKQARAAARMQRNSRRLLAMLDDFVTYMKADAGELALNPQPFDPRAQLATWANPIHSTIEEKELKLQITTSDAVPRMLMGDEALLQRIVQALLWNAVAYTAQGEIKIDSDWSTEQGWLINIQDTGSGIAESELSHIFEPFWRGIERPQLPTAGAGLGLPMARAIARLMGGDLVLSQTTQPGSKFCLQLPLKKLLLEKNDT